MNVNDHHQIQLLTTVCCWCLRSLDLSAWGEIENREKIGDKTAAPNITPQVVTFGRENKCFRITISMNTLTSFIHFMNLYFINLYI